LLTCEYVVGVLSEALGKAYFDCSFVIPPGEKHGRIEFVGSRVANRIATARTFDKLNGDRMTIRECVNFRMTLGNNLPPRAAGTMKAFAAARAEFMTLHECPPNTSIRDTLQGGAVAPAPVVPVQLQTVAPRAAIAHPPGARGGLKRPAAAQTSSRSVKRRPAARN